MQRQAVARTCPLGYCRAMAKDNDPRQHGTAAASHLGAFSRGLSLVVSVPAALLFAAGLGFGALARDGGFSIAQTAFITGGMFALPNQVVLVDQLARNETRLAVAVAVALAALRLLPLAVA